MPCPDEIGFHCWPAVGPYWLLPWPLAANLRRSRRNPRKKRPRGPVAYKISYPAGLDAESANIPKDNPLTEEKLKLGKRLYFDKSLSIDGSIACASCHIPDKGFADPNQFSIGVGGKKGWPAGADGHQSPFQHEAVLGWSRGLVGRTSRGTGTECCRNGYAEHGRGDRQTDRRSSYVAEFKAAFPPDGAITDTHIAQAIANFERTVSGNSPHDRFVAGDKSAMSEAAQRGYLLFKDPAKANCETCHVGFNFTDENYNNIGAGMAAPKPDLGYYVITKLEGHKGAFKTPPCARLPALRPTCTLARWAVKKSEYA